LNIRIFLCALRRRLKDVHHHCGRHPLWAFGVRPYCRTLELGDAGGNSVIRPLDLVSETRLAADLEALDERLVTLIVDALQVVEKRTALAHHRQKPTAGMVILLVGLEVVGEVVDAFREDRNLDFGRTGVTRLGGEFLYESDFALGSHGHSVISN
jgi:hypothetical protein